MKEMGEATPVIGIEIFHDITLWSLDLSQKAYIDKVLERYGMIMRSSSIVPMQKGGKFNLKQCPHNEMELKVMKAENNFWDM